MDLLNQIKKLFKKSRSGTAPTMPSNLKPDYINSAPIRYEAKDLSAVVNKPFPQILYAEIKVIKCEWCGAEGYTIGSHALCIHCKDNLNQIAP